ncbi:MAG: filamentous hemagglutinin N-terminal domain-containing protein, partial [Cyanobacteria bacterium P01_A01_bin.68]
MNNKIRKSNYIYNFCFGITTFCTVIYSSNLVSAQITPDNTLPNNSQVGIEENITKIEGGTTAVSNLFHSFEKFGIPTGTEAHFNNAADIQNIMTRVTGSSISDINGLIKANGAANLFLMNPNGIIFGENARLDIGGSFIGSTADSLKFGDDVEFSAINPDSKPLLSINVPLGLQYGKNPGQISNQSQARNSQGILTGLQVKPGKTLGLIGGDISSDAGIVSVGDGRVELGGINQPGIVGLSGDGNNLNNLKFNFPEGIVRSDVKLTNEARVIVPADNDGSIAINARNLEMTEQSFFIIRTINPLNSDDSRAGNIQVNATGNTRLNNSFITNLFQAQTGGQGGNVNINTNTLLLENGAVITASTLGRGKGGNLTVDAQNVQLVGVSEDGSRSSALSAFAGRNLTGDAGNLTIRTNTLLVKYGAEINSNTFGQGRGGNLTVEAQDIQVIGASKDGSDVSALSASAEPNSTGYAGELTIKTNSLLVKDGGQIAASTLGEGKGGNLTIDARDIQVIGTSKDSQFFSGLFASTEPNSTGNAGELTIKANTLLLKDGARVSASTFGEGKGGNLNIDAENIQVIGTSETGFSISGFSASAGSNSTGDAGDLRIQANTLLVKDGGQIDASTF